MTKFYDEVSVWNGFIKVFLISIYKYIMIFETRILIKKIINFLEYYFNNLKNASDLCINILWQQYEYFHKHWQLESIKYESQFN